MYQSSAGGQTYVPLEETARLLHAATPKLVKMIGSKYSEMSGAKVQTDLFDNHARHLSRDYIQKVSNALGQQIELSESSWSYSLPEKVLEQTQTVAIGRDGTTTHIRGEGYRETMSPDTSGLVSMISKVNVYPQFIKLKLLSMAKPVLMNVSPNKSMR